MDVLDLSFWTRDFRNDILYGKSITSQFPEFSP